MTSIRHEVPSYPFGTAERLDLHPRYAELRRDEPVTRVDMPFGGTAWLVTRYEDIRMVLADQRLSRAETVGKDVPRTTPAIQQDPSLLTMDPPEHSRLRKLVAKAFTARQIEALRPRVQAVIDDLLDRMIAEGSPADLATALNWPLPITVISEMLGVPMADRERFRAWTDQILALSAADLDAIMAARGHLWAYLAELIAARRTEPTDDLLGELVRARDEEDRLTEDELVNFGITLLVAGHETTANQTGNMIYLLLAKRDLWDQLVADPDKVPQAVEELLRFIPLGTAGGFARIATEDFELGGARIRAGDALIAQIASANRDGSVFDHPDEINISRAENPHVAFGHGVHHCLGAPLARIELQLAIGTLVRRLPELRLAVPADDVPWRTNRLVRGVQALPVSW